MNPSRVRPLLLAALVVALASGCTASGSSSTARSSSAPALVSTAPSTTAAPTSPSAATTAASPSSSPESTAAETPPASSQPASSQPAGDKVGGELSLVRADEAEDQNVSITVADDALSMTNVVGDRSVAFGPFPLTNDEMARLQGALSQVPQQGTGCPDGSALPTLAISGALGGVETRQVVGKPCDPAGPEQKLWDLALSLAASRQPAADVSRLVIAIRTGERTIEIDGGMVDDSQVGSPSLMLPRDELWVSQLLLAENPGGYVCDRSGATTVSIRTRDGRKLLDQTQTPCSEGPAVEALAGLLEALDAKK